jgi:hypothetical protein
MAVRQIKLNNSMRFIVVDFLGVNRFCERFLAHQHFFATINIDSLREHRGDRGRGGGRARRGDGETATGEVVPFTIDGFTIYDFSVGSGSAVFVYVNYSVFVIEEEGGDVLFRGVLDGQGEGALTIAGEGGGETEGVAGLYLLAIEFRAVIAAKGDGVRPYEVAHIHEQHLGRVLTRQRLGCSRGLGETRPTRTARRGLHDVGEVETLLLRLLIGRCHAILDAIIVVENFIAYGSGH